MEKQIFTISSDPVEKINAFLRENLISKRKLALRTGYDIRYVSLILNNHLPITKKMLQKINEELKTNFTFKTEVCL